MTTNTLFDAFASATVSLTAAGNALDTLAEKLNAVATRAEAERQRVASLLAGLPAIPAETAAGPFATTLGLDAAQGGLTAAREYLGSHAEALGILGGIAASQADRVREVRLELLAVAVPRVGPCILCGQPAQRDSLGVHACDTCAPPVPTDAVPASQDEPGRTIEPEATSGPSEVPIARQPASQEQGTVITPHAIDNGAVVVADISPVDVDAPGPLPTVGSGPVVMTTAANPPTDPTPPAPLSPVAEDTTTAPELSDAQRSALATAAGFFVRAEPGQRFGLKDILPEGGYQGRDARKALRSLPADVLAGAGIATDGKAFWRA